MIHCVSSIRSGFRISTLWAFFFGGGIWTTHGDPTKTVVCQSSFPHVLEVARSDWMRRDATGFGVICILSRIDCIFFNLPMTEARDVHCYSYEQENLGTGLFQVITQQYVLSYKKPTNRGQQGERIRSWMSEHIVCVFGDGCTMTTEPLCAFAEFKVLLNKVQKQMILEPSRKTPDSIGAKHVIVSTGFTCVQ